MKERLFQTLKTVAILGAIGLGYAFVCAFTPFRIPCPLHVLTGLYCPGCGVTRMCLSLLRFDFAGAARANLAVLVLSPVILVLLLWYLVNYIKFGKRELSRAQAIIVWTLVVLLLLFGIVRNLPYFTFLRPI